MKHVPFFLVLLLLSCSPAENESTETSKVSKEHSPVVGDPGYSTVYNIGFYNVENLFDTIDDPYTEDEWFLPESESNWDQEKYSTKLNNLAKVIDAMREGPGGPDLIGLCEVENEQVVWDLAQNELFAANVYEVVHFDSPDNRGIDVAAMYDPDKFELLDAKSIPVIMLEDPAIKTRDILCCKFAVRESNEIFYFYVNHWSSRRGGAEETFFKRKNCATALLDDMNYQFKDYSKENIIIVGDMNDYPTDKSIIDVLGAGEPKSETLLWNLQLENQKKGLGTYNYKGEWGCLDNLIVTESIYFLSTPVKILKEDWMMYEDDQGEVYPSKTYGGSNYYGGYSDHLPIYFEVEF